MRIHQGLLLSLTLAMTAAAADPPHNKNIGATDRGKSLLEAPLKQTLDITKSFVIEAPTRHVLAANSAPVPVAEMEPMAAADRQDVEHNPAVRPGLVRWHADFATACAAARKSGKPVLLFQLMGQLDQRFT